MPHTFINFKGINIIYVSASGDHGCRERDTGNVEFSTEYFINKICGEMKITFTQLRYNYALNIGKYIFQSNNFQRYRPGRSNVFNMCST